MLFCANTHPLPLAFGVGGSFIIFWPIAPETHPPSGNNNDTTPTMAPPSATSPILCHLSMSTCGTPNKPKWCVYTLFGPGNFFKTHFMFRFATTHPPPPLAFCKEGVLFYIELCTPNGPKWCVDEEAQPLYPENQFYFISNGWKALWEEYQRHQDTMA